MYVHITTTLGLINCISLDQSSNAASCCFISVILLILIGIIIAYIVSPTLSYYVHKSNTHSLPCLSDHFVGREEEVSDIVRILESKTRIVNIYGSPGFGKSMLSVHVGHRMLEKRVNVHYVNLDECPTNGVQLFIAEKVFKSTGNHHEEITFEKFVQWARGIFFHNLIILDNCDKALHSQKNELQDAIQKVVDSSDSVKFLMSSRETTLYVGEFEQYKLHELSTKAACELLQARLPSGINIIMEEKEELAKLTGNVPLALQITGSLLRLPELGSPKSVIAELRKNLITTLSPEQLQENMQINASFSLSYNYLNSKEKRIGELLSNFPGSFTIEQCIATLHSFFCNKSDNEVRSIFGGAIETLVQRSLLDVANNRYQFHSLIREYFLEKQKKRKLSVMLAFAHNFQVYFTQQLSTASLQYHSHFYKHSLAILDRERHNLQQLFDDIISHNIHSDPTTMLAAVADAINSGLLSTRFSYRDLLVVTEKIISYFNTKKMLTQFHSTKGDKYLLLMYHLIDLQEKINSTTSAMDIYKRYEHRIQYLSILAGKVYYPKILIQASNLCTKLGRHSESVEFYRLAMQYLQKTTCTQQHCSYFDLGTYLMLDENYEQAVYFFKLAIEMENPSPLQKVHILLKLHTSFEKISDSYQQSETLNEIIRLLPEVTKLPPQTLFHILNYLNTILSLLDNTDSDVTNMLTECVVRIIMMAADGNIVMNSEYPALTVSTLYNKRNYTKAAQLGTYVLQSFTQNPNFKHNQFSLKLLAATAMAKLYSGNYSQGFDAMEQVMEKIIESPEFLYNDLFSEYWQCCIYLIPRAKYAHVCFGSPIFGVVQNIIKNAVYLTFVLPLDVSPSTDNHKNIYVHQDITEIKYSSSREVAMTREFSLIKMYKNNILPSFQRWLDSIKTIIHSLFIVLMYVLSFPSLRFCINVVSILLRLDLLMFLPIIAIAVLIYIPLFSVSLPIFLVIFTAQPVLICLFPLLRPCFEKLYYFMLIPCFEKLLHPCFEKLLQPCFEKFHCFLQWTCFLLWTCFEKIYCFLLFSRKLYFVLAVSWKCCELLSFLLEQVGTFYLNHIMINFYIIDFISEKSIAHNRSCCSVLLFYSTLYFLISVVIVQTCLWLYM